MDGLTEVLSHVRLQNTGAHDFRGAHGFGPAAGAGLYRAVLIDICLFEPKRTFQPNQVYVTETLSSSKMMTIDSFGPEQSASARRGGKSRTNNAAPSYAAQEPMLPQVSRMRGNRRGRGGRGGDAPEAIGAECS